MADIFISYKSERRAAARHLAEILSAHGYSVWFDYALANGSDFALQINAEIQSAKCVLVLWCTQSVKSEWVLEEVEFARRNQNLLAAKIESCELPVGYQRLEYSDLTNWDASPRSNALDTIMDTIADLVGRPPAIDFQAMRSYESAWLSFGSPTLSQFALQPITPEQKRGLRAKLITDLRATQPAIFQSEEYTITIRRVTNSLSQDFIRFEDLYTELFLEYRDEGAPLHDIIAWLALAGKERQLPQPHWDLFIFIATKGAETVGLLYFEYYYASRFAYITYLGVSSSSVRSDGVAEKLIDFAFTGGGDAALLSCEYVFFDVADDQAAPAKADRFRLLASKLRPGAMLYRMDLDYIEARHDLDDPDSCERSRQLWVMLLESEARIPYMDQSEAIRVIRMIYDDYWGHHPKLSKVELERYRTEYLELSNRVVQGITGPVRLSQPQRQRKRSGSVSP